MTTTTLCRVCKEQPATHVIEGNTVTTLAGEPVVQASYEVACSNTFCLGVLARWANRDASVHVDTHVIRPVLCQDGLIGVWCGAEWEFFACSGCPGCEATP